MEIYRIVKLQKSQKCQLIKEEAPKSKAQINIRALLLEIGELVFGKNKVLFCEPIPKLRIISLNIEFVKVNLFSD